MTRPAALPPVELTAAARRYLQTESGGALLLLLATVTALVWVNSPFAGAYEDLWGTELTVQLGDRELREDLRHWVNDGLMTLFFLLVGLEIARELSVGEYRDRRAVIAPALAALGGLALPALVYLAIAGGEAARGWGIAISTDTAFALGILALVGPRCPNRLRIFLLALAIVDDIAAIAVIAVFYTEEVDVAALTVAILLIGVLGLLRRLRVHDATPYVLVAVLVWLATLTSGVHPTVAGVAMGLLFASYRPSELQLEPIPEMGRSFLSAPTAERARTVVRGLSSALPLNDRISLRLHPLISFVAVPLFALANAGVDVRAGVGSAFHDPVTWGVLLGLLLGKPVGILLASWLALRSGIASMPDGASRGHIVGVSVLCGIGFTMSLFVANLAFPGDEAHLTAAKVGVLGASLVAGVVGGLIIARSARRAGDPLRA